MPLGSIMLGIVLEVIWSALSLFVSIVLLSPGGVICLMMLLVILDHFNIPKLLFDINWWRR